MVWKILPLFPLSYLTSFVAATLFFPCLTKWKIKKESKQIGWNGDIPEEIRRSSGEEKKRRSEEGKEALRERFYIKKNQHLFIFSRSIRRGSHIFYLTYGPPNTFMLPFYFYFFSTKKTFTKNAANHPIKYLKLKIKIT